MQKNIFLLLTLLVFSQNYCMDNDNSENRIVESITYREDVWNLTLSTLLYSTQATYYRDKNYKTITCTKPNGEIKTYNVDIGDQEQNYSLIPHGTRGLIETLPYGQVINKGFSVKYAE